MATLKKVQVLWSGFIGAPGVSTFYFDTAGAPPLPALRTMFEAWCPYIPSVVQLDFPNSGVTIDTSTGQPNGTWTTSSVVHLQGDTAVDYAAPSGAVVNWLTGAFVNGRQIRGKTFVVPIISSAYFSDGTLDGATVTGLLGPANTFLATTPHLAIYSRRASASATVTSAAVPDMAAVLRSRRD